MTEYLAESVLDKLSRELYNNNLTLGTRKATDWLMRKVKTLDVDRRKLMRDNERLSPQTFIGQMQFYQYDAKHKAVLPYFDAFPLVIPIKIDKTGFEGLNLHYISPRERMVFLRELTGYTNNTAYNETTRFRLTYNLLQNVSSLDQYRPTYKRYLWSHVRSQFLHIDGHDWYIACALPVANFKKASESQVFRESRVIRKRRIQHG